MNTVGFGVGLQRFGWPDGCLPMSEKGVIMGRMLVSVCGVGWDNR